MWTSLNDGIGSGLDADRLDGKQGTWYQNALNINTGTVSDNRLPRFISATKFRDTLTVQSFNGDPKYKIYLSGRILNVSPFTPGNTVNLYDANAQATGQIAIDNLIINDVADGTEDYTIIVGRLTTGNFVGALTIGSAANREEFQDFTIDDDNVVEVAKLESDGGTANLRLGRRDGVATSPALYFTSAQLVPSSYNAAIVATGGNSTDGSGTLNVLVANANGLNVNGNVVWNAGNITFQSTNVANTAVKRDASGNFAAGTITASITGAASLNVLKAGDTMTGSLSLTGASSNLSVAGTGTFLSTVSITDDLAVDTDTLFVDVSADEVGINAGVAPRSTLDVVGDLGVYIRSATSGAGAKLRFSDNVGNDWAQQGTISYVHVDASTPNAAYGEAFLVSGTETTLAFQVTGDVIATRRIGINVTAPSLALDVGGGAKFTEAITVQNTSNGALNFYNNTATRYWRVGSNTQSNNFFTFQASTAAGGTTFNSTPALGISGINNAVTINTTDTSGVDPTDGTTQRNYKLNVSGDVNINGQLFQNNAEFVTSRWTEASNGADIYRLSRVGINKADPSYQLHVLGSVNIEGQDFVNEANNRVLYANGIKQWLDTYGTFKSNRNFVDENITIPSGYNAGSFGPITINNEVVITIADGGSWNVV
jgi:hypothetical protein